MTNTSAVLSWSPAMNGGGRPLFEIVYTITVVGEYRVICHYVLLVCMGMDNYPHVSPVCESAESFFVHIIMHTYTYPTKHVFLDTENEGGVISLQVEKIISMK